MRYHEILSEMRTDSEAFERLDRADKWLAKYTYEGLDRWPPKGVIEELLKRYPNKTAATIYRGMNFETKEQFDEFMQNPSHMGGISSWSCDRNQAYEFALTRKSYFLDRDVMTSYSDAEKSGEIVTGYRGVILSTEIAPGQGIDVNASHLGHENEIILPSGDYNVKIEQIKKFADKIADGDDHFNDMVLRATSLDKETMYALQHHKNELSREARHHLFTLMSEHSLDKQQLFAMQDQPTFGTDRNIDCPYVNTNFHTAKMLLRYTREGLFLPEDEKLVIALATKECRRLALYIKQHPNSIFVMNSIKQFAQLCGPAGDVVMTALKTHVAKQYHDINARLRKEFKPKTAHFWAQKMAEIVNQMS